MIGNMGLMIITITALIITIIFHTQKKNHIMIIFIIVLIWDISLFNYKYCPLKLLSLLLIMAIFIRYFSLGFSNDYIEL